MTGTPVHKIISKLKGTKICYLTSMRASKLEEEHLLSVKNVVSIIYKPYTEESLILSVREIIGK